MRYYHRTLATLLMLFLLYLGVTGTAIQLIDLRAILSGKPATDADIMAIREGIDGSNDFAVIGPADYQAPSFPEGFNFQTAMGRLVRSARLASAAGGSIKFAELRYVDGAAVGQVKVGERVLRFDALTTRPLPGSDVAPPEFAPRPSSHLTMKNWHRLHSLSDLILWVNALVGIGLFVMILTGLILYFRLLRARPTKGRGAPFWTAGGAWRTIHRWVSVVAAAFLLVVAVTGTMLAIDSFCLGIDRATRGMMPPGNRADNASPLREAAVSRMLTRTLTSFQALHPHLPIKVVRLRVYSGMPQGVVISGGDGAQQWVFNAASGASASTTEPGYPRVAFPFGWHEHEFVKQIHRGDIIGVPGRLMNLFAGLSLIFLVVSGSVMYFDLWRRRRKASRPALMWK